MWVSPETSFTEIRCLHTVHANDHRLHPQTSSAVKSTTPHTPLWQSHSNAEFGSGQLGYWVAGGGTYESASYFSSLFLMWLYLVALGSLLPPGPSLAAASRPTLHFVDESISSSFLFQWNTGLQGCKGLQLQRLGELLCGKWGLPGPGNEPVSHALAGGFLSTVPQGGPSLQF